VCRPPTRVFPRYLRVPGSGKVQVASPPEGRVHDCRCRPVVTAPSCCLASPDKNVAAGQREQCPVGGPPRHRLRRLRTGRGRSRRTEGPQAIPMLGRARGPTIHGSSGKLVARSCHFLPRGSLPPGRAREHVPARWQRASADRKEGRRRRGWSVGDAHVVVVPIPRNIRQPRAALNWGISADFHPVVQCRETAETETLSCFLVPVEDRQDFPKRRRCPGELG